MQNKRDKVETKKKDKKDDIANILTARSALLDFFSDRAGSFASFFVASIFGLATLLTIVQGIKRNNPLEYGALIVVSFVVYVAFASAGYHTFKRFVHYADIADRLVGYHADKLERETARRSLIDIAELEKLKFYTQPEGKEWKETTLKEHFIKQTEKQDRQFARKILKRKFNLLYGGLIGLLWILVFLPKIVDILVLVFPCLVS